MTELHWGLIGLGVVVVTCVALYNIWQEYRHRKLTKDFSEIEYGDPLFGGELGKAGKKPKSGPKSAEKSGESGESRDSAGSSKNDALERIFGGAPEKAEKKPGVFKRFLGVFRKKTPGALDTLDDFPELRIEPGLTEDFSERGNAGIGEGPPSARGAGGNINECGENGEPVLSPLIDYIAAFETAVPVSARQIAGFIESTRDGIQKPVAALGYDDRRQSWEPLGESGHAYRLFRVGAQLVDRHGAIAAGDAALFHQAMRNLAEKLGELGKRDESGGADGAQESQESQESQEFAATLQIPKVENALEAAAKLDAFAESVDIQIGINILAGEENFHGKDLRQLAESSGMTLEGGERFICRDAEGHILYSLVNAEPAPFSGESLKTLTTRGLTFLLDVPSLPNGEAAFERMLALARHFAAALKGKLVDDNGREFSETSLEPVRERIVQCQAAMTASGLPAGGPLARRLFS